jgi:hypothetical protein
MAEFKQSFGSEVALTMTGFSTLANTSTVTGEAVSNATNLYEEIILEIQATYSEANAAAAWLDVRILASIDGGTDYSSWTTPAIILPGVDMSAGGGSTTVIYHARFVPPQRWKLAVKNNTGYALDVGSASYQGVTYTSA